MRFLISILRSILKFVAIKAIKSPWWPQRPHKWLLGEDSKVEHHKLISHCPFTRSSIGPLPSSCILAAAKWHLYTRAATASAGQKSITFLRLGKTDADWRGRGITLAGRTLALRQLLSSSFLPTNSTLHNLAPHAASKADIYGHGRMSVQFQFQSWNWRKKHLPPLCLFEETLWHTHPLLLRTDISRNPALNPLPERCTKRPRACNFRRATKDVPCSQGALHD